LEATDIELGLMDPRFIALADLTDPEDIANLERLGVKKAHDVRFLTDNDISKALSTLIASRKIQSIKEYLDAGGVIEDGITSLMSIQNVLKAPQHVQPPQGRPEGAFFRFVISGNLRSLESSILTHSSF
jgi:hypothetical protein